MRHPRVSVWIASYNYERYLPAAIDSVLGQTLQDFELIIVEDGSKDGSLAVARRYAARHPEKIRVVQHEGGVNRGVSATINLALRASRGRHVCGLPADDVLPEDSLAVRSDYLDAHPEVDFVYGRVFVFDDADPSSGTMSGTDITGLPEPCEAFIRWNPVQGMAVMARRECWAGTGDHAEGLDYSDWQFWFRMFARYRGAYIDRVLARQRAHGGNYSIGNQPRRYREYSHALLRNLDEIWGATVPRLDVPRNRARLNMMLALHSFFARQVPEAHALVQRALQLDEDAVVDPAFLSGWIHNGVYYWTREPDAANMDFFEWLEAELASANGRSVARGRTDAVLRALVPQLLDNEATRGAARRILSSPGALGSMGARRFAKMWTKYLVGPAILGKARMVLRGGKK